MTQPTRRYRWTWIVVVGVLVCAVGAACVVYLTWNSLTQAAEPPQRGDEADTSPQLARVEIVHPVKGAMDRTTVQPGTVQAYEAAQLFAEVPGYMKSQTVDIGDRVKRGQVLATVDVPELEKQVQRFAAVVEQTKSKVRVMVARVACARAELDVAKASIVKFEAAAASAAANRSLREKQLRRYRDLFASKSIDERLV